MCFGILRIVRILWSKTTSETGSHRSRATAKHRPLHLRSPPRLALPTPEWERVRVLCNTLMGHKKEAARPVLLWSVLLSGWSGCRAVSAAVRPLCAVGLSGSCQAVTLGPDSDGSPLMSGSAVRLSDTCCQAVRESAVNAVRLSGTVRRCPGFAVRLSDQGSGRGPVSAHC